MRNFFKATIFSMPLVFVLMGTLASAETSSGENSPLPAASVQKAVLYEEDAADPLGKRYVGWAIWRTGMASPRPGQPPEIAIDAEIEVPERKLALTWSLRRNGDQTLPASHVVEIMFKVPADSPFGSVAKVPGILMKPAEQTRGVALAGAAVKVTGAYFMFGLSNKPSDKQRNLELLSGRGWIDIPMVYGNNRRAILAVEKGAAGIRVFGDVLAAWGQSQPVTRPSTPDSPPQAQRRTSIGTGFILTTAGHVLTNSHVVAGCVSIGLKAPENSVTPARIIAREEIDDLVVLKTDARLGAAATLRMSPSPRTGEAIVVFGFPLSGLLASTGNVTIGNITALAGLRDDSRQLQISAPVQPGNSGGPVLDRSGNVIGVVVSKLDALRVARLADDIPQNINFAIKSSTVMNFLDARGIPYSSGQPGKELSIPDIAEHAKAISVEVRCER